MAGYEVGSAYLSVIPKADGFARTLGNDLDGTFLAAGQRGGTTLSTGVARTGRPGFLASGAALGGAFAGAFAIAGGAQIVSSITQYLSSAITSASDLSETQSKVGQIFGDSAAGVQDFARTAASRLGQSQQTVLDGASTFGIFGQAAGLAGEDLSTFSTDMVTLATDLASFNNTSTEDAIGAIGSALRGEAEPIRNYGVLLDDATLKARAFELGIYDGTDALTPQQRVLAAHAEILAQTSTQQGDFERTSEGMANKQRILTAEMENTKAEIGTALLPVMNDLLGVFADEAVPILQELAGWFMENKDEIGAMVLAVVDGALAFGQGLAGYLEHMSRMADVWLTWTTNLAQTFLNVVGIVIDGAANMFGWVPGLGDDLRTAQGDFSEFRTKVDTTFAGMRTAADQTTRMYQGVQDSISGIRTKIAELDGARATVTVDAYLANIPGTAQSLASRNFVGGVSRRAGGGDVTMGQPYLVGEREAELFVPNQSGTILNQSQMSAAGIGGGAPMPEFITLVDADGSILARTRVVAGAVLADAGSRMTYAGRI